MERPILEYGSVIWSPHQIGHFKSLNMVQKRFLQLTGVRRGLAYLDVDVHEIAQQYDLLSLASWRIAMDLIFFFKTVNDLIDCPEQLQPIDFHVPSLQRTWLASTLTKHRHFMGL
jgi:hypothetical protein